MNQFKRQTLSIDQRTNMGSGSKSNHGKSQQPESEYTHDVQNTEECMAADGDQDEPELSGLEDEEYESAALFEGFGIN
jgi:hypothetical protein